MTRDKFLTQRESVKVIAFNYKRYEIVLYEHGTASNRGRYDYKNIAYGSLFYDRLQDLYINTISFRHHDRKGPMVSNNGCLMLFIGGFKAAFW